MVASRDNISKIIIDNKVQLNLLGAKSLGLFGSFARNEASSQSDIDLIVQFQEGKKSYDNFIQIVYLLEELLGRKVELVTEALSVHTSSPISKKK